MKEQIACIVLGAGFGRRFGGDKALAKFQGATVGGYVLEAISEMDFDEVLVVRREGQGELELPKGKALRVIHLPTHLAEQGLHFSLSAGIRALNSHWTWLCIALLDQPLLRSHHFRELLDCRSWDHEKNLIMPVGAQGRGNPALVHSSYREEILANEGGDFGCGYLFKRYPRNVLALASSDEAYFYDVDKPGDLAYGNHSPVTD